MDDTCLFDAYVVTFFGKNFVFATGIPQKLTSEP